MTDRGPGRGVADIAVTAAMLGRARRGQTAVVDASSGRRRKTYGGLTAAVWSAAAGLTRSGVRRGDVVAVHLPDVPELILALHAVIAAGAVPTPVPVRSSVEDLAERLTDSKARALITWPVLLDTVVKAIESAPMSRIFCFGDGGGEAGVVAFETLFTAHAPRDLRVRAPAKDLALLPYTRGTTKAPTAVRLTHRAVVAGARAIVGAGLIRRSDIAASELPLTDLFALQTIVHPALIAGATVVTRAGRGRHELLKALQERRVTTALLTAETIAALAFHRELKRYDMSSLRTIICAESALDPEAALACQRRLDCTVQAAYGLTEAGGLTHISEPAAEPSGSEPSGSRPSGTELDFGEGPAPGSVGVSLPHVQTKIVDPSTGESRAPFDLGELWLCSEAGVHGWIHTGDRAFADEDGRYFIVGRRAAPKGGPKAPRAG